MDLALQGKRIWRFMVEIDILWRRVIEAKFDTTDSGRYTGVNTRPHGKGLWKKIYMEKDKF